MALIKSNYPHGLRPDMEYFILSKPMSMQYLGPGVTGHDVQAVQDFGAKPEPTENWSRDETYELIIPISEGQGQHIASIGDWIIKGIRGEFYVNKTDILC